MLDRIFNPIARFLCCFLSHLLFWPRVSGKEYRAQRRNGPGLMICNHSTIIDPVILLGQIHRRIHFFSKEELFQTRFKRWFFRTMDCHPVKRGSADLAAIKHALTVLRNEGLFCIFPEGTRHNKGDFSDLASGAALISMRSGVAVTPVYIRPPYRVFRRQRVCFGKPVDLQQFSKNAERRRDDLEGATNVLAEAMRKLMQQAQTN